MAKGNLLQGQARGKVGDVVFSRANGEQVSRLRNRNPKNPKTAKQMYQRAIMATVMQAYKAGQKIFDHSFQDQPKGAGNQKVFIRENAKILRRAIADALTAPDILQTTARTVAPSAVAPVPNEYLISRGTYENTQTTTSGPNVYFVGNSATSTWEEFYSVNDYREGDLFTVVFFTSETSFAYSTLDEDGNPDPLRTVKNANFHFVRLRVKPIPEGAVPNRITLNLFLEVTGTDLDFDEDVLTYEPLTLPLNLITSLSANIRSVGVIRSREDSNLRSTSYMSAPTVEFGYGLAANVVGEIWRKGTQSLGESDLILEGGDDESGGVAPVPRPIYEHRLLLRNGTITNEVPENISDVVGIEFTTGKFIVGGSFSARKAVGGSLVNQQGDSIDTVSTLQPSASLPSGAIAMNRYLIVMAIPVVLDFINQFDGDRLDWIASDEDEAYSCEYLQTYEAMLISVEIDTLYQSTHIQMSGVDIEETAFVWYVNR